jgi:hypothetical protein
MNKEQVIKEIRKHPEDRGKLISLQETLAAIVAAESGICDLGYEIIAEALGVLNWKRTLPEHFTRNTFLAPIYDPRYGILMGYSVKGITKLYPSPNSPMKFFRVTQKGKEEFVSEWIKKNISHE